VTSFWIRFPGAACVAVLSVLSVTPTRAANINTSMIGCQTTLGPSDQLNHAAYGTTTGTNTAVAQMVVCNVPRAPLGAGSISGSFYVDGDNFNATTSCSLFSFDADGHLAGIASFQTSLLHYDILLTLDAVKLTDLGHTSLRCLLPAHNAGVLRGVTSLQ
jgi:hypothetical protein